MPMSDTDSFIKERTMKRILIITLTVLLLVALVVPTSAINITEKLKKLQIYPTSNVVPLTIKGVSGQTADLIKCQDSTGTDVWVVKADGTMGLSDLAIVGNITVGDDADMVCDPDVAASATAYTLDTSVTHTSGKLVDFVNNTASKASIGFDGSIYSGGAGIDGKVTLYSEQGATDYAVTLNPNAAMTSAADFFLPADEATESSFLTTTTDGIFTFTHAAHYGALAATSTWTGAQTFTGGKAVADPLTDGTMTATNKGEMRTVWSRYDWTNAMVTALGASLTGDITVCTLPAKTIVKRVIMVVDSQAAGTTTLTGAVGRTATGYTDYLLDSNLQVAANTIYGDVQTEVGGKLYDGTVKYFPDDIPSITTTTAVKMHLISSVANLDQVTGCTGHIYIQTSTLP
jgi:hypothetical protein